MKTITRPLLFAVTLFAAASSFGQSRLGVTGSARASVSKSVDASNATSRARHAADHATTHAVEGSQQGVHAARTRATETKSVVAAKGQTAASSATEVAEAQKSRVVVPDVKVNAGATSRGRIHASEQGQERSSESSILNRSQTTASVNAGAQVQAEGQQDIEKTGNAKDRLDKSARAEARAEKKAAKAARKAEKAESKASQIKHEGRASSQASVNASGNAKVHANENSAIFGAREEKSSEVRKKESGPSLGTKSKTRSKVKAAKS